MILAVLATLGAAAVAFVLYPMFTEGRRDDIAGLGEDELELRELEEKKARLYAAITDLDFEKDAGKVSEGDHQTARSDYLAQVAAVMGRMDALAPGKGRRKAGAQAEKKPEETAEPSRRCESCKASSPASAKFCIHCGATFAPPEKTCAECGETLPGDARFCMSCGRKVAAAR